MTLSTWDVYLSLVGRSPVDSLLDSRLRVGLLTTINHLAIPSPRLFAQVSMHVLIPKVTLYHISYSLTTRSDIQEGTDWLHFFL